MSANLRAALGQQQIRLRGQGLRGPPSPPRHVIGRMNTHPPLPTNRLGPSGTRGHVDSAAHQAQRQRQPHGVAVRTMATVHAGSKRSYHQMRGAQPDDRHFVSLPPSREQSPKLTTPFRSASAAPDYPPGPERARQLQERPRTANFDTCASIVLVGVRGTGKSSLGVIAAAAYNYRLIETQRAFSDATGTSSSSYRASCGSSEFQRKTHEILRHVLDSYPERAVIVCSFSDLENGGASLLQDYAQAHPVIHVTRDSQGLHDYFRTWTLERVKQLLLASSTILRSCSNFEFFNLTETTQAHEDSHPSQSIYKRDRDVQGKYLTLKRVERDFLRLLRNVVGDSGRSIAHHSAYPLSQIDVDKRLHTFAVRLALTDVIRNGLDLEVAQRGADCIELVAALPGQDKQVYLQEIAHAFAIVRRNSILPIWLTVSAEATWPADGSESLCETISHCLSFGPELCSADLRLSNEQLERLVENKASTKLIAQANFEQRPHEGWSDQKCMETYHRATELGFDMVNMTMPSDSVETSYDAKAFSSSMKRMYSSPSVIAYEEGPNGRPSKCFNEILTSVRPPDAAFKSPRSDVDARSHISARSITEALFANFILEPLRFYIYGRDVSYSLSPAMGNAAYVACGMRHELTTFECSDLTGLQKLVQEPDFGGAAILQPFKTAVMPMIDTVSSHARAIGAVNTVVPIRSLATDGSMPKEIDIIRQRNRQGALHGLYGTNTDWIGIRSCVRRGLSPANSVRPVSTGVVCGAGGMARAAIHSLASLGCQNIYICNRTPANAHVLADHYNSLIEAGDIPELGTSSTNNTRVRVIESFADPWPSNARHPTMIVCCIPADSADGTRIDFKLPPAWLKSPTGGVVVEVAYKRPVTPLISQIHALADQGWILHDGFDVLPEQAYAQFEMFTGRRAPRKLMKDQVLNHYHAMTAAEAKEG